MDGTGICRGFDENLQQAIDRMLLTCVAAMIELLSPQLAAASYVGTLVTPTEVAMHAATDDDSDDENPYAACCNDDLDHLSNDELQSLVHGLSGQLKKGRKPAARGGCAAPPKKKTIEASLPPAPTVPTVATPPATASTNLSSDTTPVSKVIPSKPIVLQTVVPQVRSSDQKAKGKDPSGPDFHYQCPIEDKADAKKVFDHILDVSIPVTARETLSTSPLMQSTPSTNTDTTHHVFKYKPVAKKIKPVPTTLPEEFRTTRKIIGNPLADMPKLSPHPIDFTLTGRYDKETQDIIDANHPSNFLLPEE